MTETPTRPAPPLDDASVPQPAARPHRRRRRLLFMVLVATLAIIGVQTAASANGGSTSIASGCSKVWNTSSYGGYGTIVLHWTYSPYAPPHHLHVSSWDAHTHTYDCGPAGRDISAYQVKLSIKIQIQGSGLTSCSIGIPAGFSCTFSLTTVYIQHDVICGHNIVTCANQGGPFDYYPPAGGDFGPSAPKIQAAAQLIGSTGSGYSFSTPQTT